MKISIIDDHKLLSELLKRSLMEFDFIKTVNLYHEPDKLFAHLDKLETDLLITDILMPEINGTELIERCRKIKNKSQLKILVLSTVIDPHVIKEALKSGANGYLCKNASIEELIRAIKFIHNEEKRSYIGESLKDILVQSQLFETIEFNLSPREKELLQYICKGQTVKEIAPELGLSINTIQSYLKQLMRKMEVNRTPDLILKAIKYGLFHPNYVS
ncbi:response regulator transcription factor [Pedobacter punctiformis]|uniref:Response regulator transcription factor n=1 Tax=Pedobacter punctiformis TaxID=3004097 RepID=A0ABT4L8E9_9SPHI|nr:response regulator transcription factor [Pedobacter sp. HCMS5-2]MCZ4244106.1 response regulator transcription factor [Pedobacter sp. HCMS5-2]